MIPFLQSSKIVIYEESTDPNDLRFKNIIHQRNPAECEHVNIGLIGIPFDFGVMNSNGRIGASEAPDAIRSQIKKYGTAYNMTRGADLSTLSIADFGNISMSQNSVEKTHERVTRTIKELLVICDTLIVLGGGNDLTYATVRALKEICEGQIGGHAKRGSCPAKLSGMNVDAHLDVRDVRTGKINSGTPYRRLIEDGILRGNCLFEVGIQGHVNSKSYWDWAQEQGIRIFTLEHVREDGIRNIMLRFRTYLDDIQNVSRAFVSIDIDSVAQAFAPGSSAPSPDGLFPQDILAMAYEAGKMSKVRLFEIMEVNPRFDQDNRTSRLAVNIMLEFLAGYTKRR